MSTATIQIILNANGNLGSALDAASGKVLRLGHAAKGAGATVSAETRTAAGAVAAMGEQASKAFGSAGSSLAKFAGPLGALGGVAAVSGLAISNAMELAGRKIKEFMEEPAKLTMELNQATKAAEALVKARDAAILGNVGKLAPSAEELVAQGGPQALALARQISVDTGIEFKDTAAAVSAGLGAGMGDNAIRRMVEGAQLADRTGRMPFAEAVKAGAGRVNADLSAAEVASDMANRAGYLAWLDDPTSEFTAAPGTTPTDFAVAEARLAADPVAQAAAAQRRSAARQADLAFGDVSAEGGRVVLVADMQARAERRNPGLARHMERDAELAMEEDDARALAEANPWNFLGGRGEAWGDVRRIAEKRARRTRAFFAANPGGGRDDFETVDQFQARITAEKDRLEQARKANGIPFGEGTARVEALLERIAQGMDETARNTGQGTPAPLAEAQ